jgi:hypothetical protein
MSACCWKLPDNWVPAEELSNPDEVTCGSDTDSTSLLAMGVAGAAGGASGAAASPMLPGTPCEVPSSEAPSPETGAAGCCLGLPHALTTGAGPLFSELGYLAGGTTTGAMPRADEMGVCLGDGPCT